MRPSLPSASPSSQKPAPDRQSTQATPPRPNVATQRAYSQTAARRPSLAGATQPSAPSVTQPRLSSEDLDSIEEGSTDGRLSSGEASRREQVRRNSSGQKSVSSPDEIEIARLRAAVSARVLASMQRPFLGSKKSASSRSSSGVFARPQHSPIKEESASPDILSPMTAAFSSPLATSKTSSSESTNSSSARTVRGSAAATPAAQPLRTPSYPFPYVPGTPRAWSSTFHQPFTVLSPTTSSGPYATTGDSTISGASTPAANPAAFAPPGDVYQGMEDPRYPTPSLYELALQLTSEPGLEAWWATVAKMMREMYLADRVSLALPADSNDIENVPWGQKATFNVSGQYESSEELGSTSSSSGRSRPFLPSHQSSFLDDASMAGTPRGGMRPALETRHSYAGHIPVSEEPLFSAPAGAAMRPSVSRTKSHAPNLLPSRQYGAAPPLSRQASSVMGIRHSSISDPDFSSIGGEMPPAPYVALYPVLKGLDSEADGLLDTGGVNRVLERGKMVTLTRDYTTEQVKQHQSTSPSEVSTIGPSSPRPPAPISSDSRQLFGNFRVAALATDATGQRRLSAFEEYEQVPPSPWSQSPAPSPAIQVDADTNPFFASVESVESSFDPSATPDYSQFEAVEAIGVDSANTVIHLPLIHPTLSLTMPSFREEAKDGPQSGRGESESSAERSEHSGRERKAPIAILSILSPAVPFPENLVHSLKLLGPHLATSYHMAYQFTSVHRQALGLRHRRGESGHNVGLAHLSIDPRNLDDLVRADFEEKTGSVSGSMTSPSDYSGRSLHSPTSSIVGTPGWDPSTYGLNNKSLTGTPAQFSQAEMIDNYFDVKKRQTVQRPVSNPVPPPAALTNLAKNGKNSPAPLHLEQHHRVVSRTIEDDQASPRSERKLKGQSATRSDNSPLWPTVPRGASPSRSAEMSSPRRHDFLNNPAQNLFVEKSDREHSRLHSYGADFSSSFQSLPAATTPKASTAALPHVRHPSITETADMPPPSERLLRVIIDSLPVQVFTATPGTGTLTWVNSKFLVYRGQDQRQVLSDPWQAIHPNDRVSYMESWNRSLRTGQQLQQKVRMQRFDGNYRWFYVRAAPLKDKKQNIVHWIGTNMDFHEQHVAEQNSARQQETAASEAKYRALANSSPQVVFTVNRAKGVTFCNTQWVIYSGQTEAKALGLGFMEHVHVDDIVKCRLPTFGESGTQVTNVPITMPAEPVRSKSSSNTSSSGSSDTERGPTSPLHTSPTAQLPQTKLSQLASTGILKVSRDADGKSSYSTEVRLRSKEGDFRWHLVRVVMADSALRLDGQEEDTWYGTCTDINDHKALERDLKETMDEKSRFLSNMSHEIRTPLNGITGMVNFLIDSSMTTEQMEHVNIIRASTEGLRGLINDILDLSKAEAGMIQLNMEWLHVRSVIEEVNDLTSAMAIDKGLELNYLVEADVPSQIKGDRFRLRQILLNVIGNAIKFTQVGEIFIRCSVLHDKDYEPSKGEMYVQFEVVDSGRGFTDKEAQILFKRFSQIDGSSTRQHGGTGLGLVISRQLAHLHGGDMSAKGVPGKGATFAFWIKSILPSAADQPAAPPPTPGPSFPLPPVAEMPSIIPVARASNVIANPIRGKASPRLAAELTQSPSPYASPSSPTMSSGSSDPSIRTSRTSIRSERSSASSFVPDLSVVSSTPMKLAMPTGTRAGRSDTGGSLKGEVAHALTASDIPSAIRMISPGGSMSPPIYSILVVCPLKHSREATVQHMDMTLPKNVPHQITARENLMECQKMIGGEDPVIFSHVVLILQSIPEVVAFMDQIFTSAPHSHTQLIIITDLMQKRRIMEQAPEYKYDQLSEDRRVRWIFKPLKPSKFAVIFDPGKEREMSTDRNQDSAQQVAITQKQVYEELTKRLGNQGKRVLLVEDNRVNQMVLLKFLSKVAIQVETVLDGVLCLEKIYAKPHGYYSIILCDLHMPNKDGYQTCLEIRKWEKQNKYAYLPIIALSANVLGDVYDKCADAGFNSYVTKPVDFKELSNIMITYLDPKDPSRPIEFMKHKK